MAAPALPVALDVRPVLAVNAGSTSLKSTLLSRAHGQWERDHSYDDLDVALAGAGDVEVVLHRVVHGGPRRRPVLVDDAVLAELEVLTELAPLHQPPALEALRRARAALPGARHVACFDTAFHHSIPAAAATYALPERLRALVGVYGFHGLSHAWAASQARARFPRARRVLVAHLGGGASLCAVLDGRSTATTMGFTPMDGLVMATRSGAVDPGALLWLARNTDEDLEQVLASESGLLGLCGTPDLGEVLARARRGDDSAVLARDVYVHRLVTSIGAMAAAMEGLDVLVFTGGAGEHSGELRELVSGRLGWLGVQACPGGTPEHGSRVEVLVVPAAEDLQMAADARDLLPAAPPTTTTNGPLDHPPDSNGAVRGA